MISIRDASSIFLVSILGALVGCLFVAVMQSMIAVMGPHGHGVWLHVGIMVAVGFAVAGIKRWVGNPGDINMLVDNIHISGGRADRRELKSLIPTSLLCIASGGAMGPEAPLVQTTAAIGTAVGKRQQASIQQIRILTISSMATGFALLFGAPIGAAIFALELMHRRGFEYYEAFIPAMTGALVGYTVNAGILGFGLVPVWNVDVIDSIAVTDVFWGAVAGILGAGVGVSFVWLVRFQKKIFAKFPEWSVPVIGGLGLGLLGVWNPYSLTFGEEQLMDTMDGSMLTGALLAAGIAKLIASSLTLSSGWKGGFIIPLFFVGAAFGQMVPESLPGLSQTLIFAMAMMVGANASVTKTPIGSALVVSGMCGLPALAPCLVAGLSALFISDRLVLFTAQRNRTS